MEELLRILKDLRPNIDFETQERQIGRAHV